MRVANLAAPVLTCRGSVLHECQVRGGSGGQGWRSGEGLVTFIFFPNMESALIKLPLRDSKVDYSTVNTALYMTQKNSSIRITCVTRFGLRSWTLQQLAKMPPGDQTRPADRCCVERRALRFDKGVAARLEHAMEARKWDAPHSSAHPPGDPHRRLPGVLSSFAHLHIRECSTRDRSRRSL